MRGIVGGILSDCLGIKGVPTGAASSALGKLMNKRYDTLRHIIRSEIREGNFDRVDEDVLVSICFRMIRDAEEGVARNNLRLMARIINGMAEKKELKAPNFLKYANILASLTEDEITVLGVMAQLNWRTFIGDRGAIECKGLGIENIQSVQQALLRTGLLTMQIRTQLSDERENRNLGIRSAEPTTDQVYTLTPLFSEIEKYIENFDVQEEAA